MKTIVIRSKEVAIGNFPKIGKHSIQINQGLDKTKTITINFRSTTATTLELKGCTTVGLATTVSIPAGFAFTSVEIIVNSPVAYVYLPSTVAYAFNQVWTTITNESPFINYRTTFNNLNSAQAMFFNSKKFNDPVNIYSSVLTSFADMFRYATSFNSKVNLPTSSANTLQYMFDGAYSYNQEISDWNVSNIVDMRGFLRNATSFNKDLSKWNFNKEVNLLDFMTGKSSLNYKASYYDALLQKWASNFIGSGRVAAKVISMGTIKYTLTGKPFRDALVADGFTITDGGLA